MQLRRASLIFALAAAFSGAALAQTCPGNGTAVSYPLSKKVDQQDNYHGTMVADPYRWLEDANSAETKEWVDAQNKLTQSYLGQIPAREAIKARLTKLWNFSATVCRTRKAAATSTAATTACRTSPCSTP